MSKVKTTELEASVLRQYMKKTLKSKQLYEKALGCLQGGVSAGTRFYAPYPIYTSHGRGSRVYDVDGNEYIDNFLSAGPLLLGHCHPEVIEAVKREVERGLLSYNQELAVECAELLKEIVPCAEKVRFSNTGSEATMLAVRVAKAFTGRNKIIKFYGHYHGIDDQFSVGTYNDSDEPDSGGVSQDHFTTTILLKYNDMEAIKRKLEEDRDIAAIILDPQMSAGGVWPPSPEYLKELRRLTKKEGVVLIFDEVLTGFRVALGGAQEYFGVVPDLAVFAKAFDGGGKCSALVGKKEVMSILGPKGSPFVPEGKKLAIHAGTYIDSTVGLAAATASMKVYKRLNGSGEYQKLFERSRRLKEGIEAAFEKRSMPLHINMCGPYLKLFFTDLKPTFEAYCKLDVTIHILFWLALISEGIYLNPSLRSILLSFVHTDQDVQKAIDAVHSALDRHNFEEVLGR
jgi:glutamate-1-semialdehyde 2,1-aminomutase